MTAQSRWFHQQLALQVQQLVELVERHCRGEPRQAACVNEIVMIGAGISQLTGWLPREQATSLLKLNKILPALLQARDAAVVTRLLQWLYSLHQQLQPSAGVAAASHLLQHKPKVNAKPALVAQLANWLRQQQAETSGFDSLSLQLLLRLVSAWRDSELTPAMLGDSLWQLKALLHFSASAGVQQDFDEIASRLCVALVCPHLSSDEEQLQCWEALHLLLQQQQSQGMAALPSEDIELLQAAQTDLNRYRPRLQHYLQRAVSTPTLVSQEVMTLHYKLPWLLAAAGQPVMARLYHCWYQLLSLHWKYKLCLSIELLDLLTQTTSALNLQQWLTLTTAQVVRWQWRLFQLWPAFPLSNIREIALQSTTLPPVELTAIPVLLSRSFNSLSNCRAEWFVDADALQTHHAALEEDLLLLEKGAAAVRIHEVEIFCSQLLALHQKTALKAQDFPGALLWRSHQHLLALLDEAAAWQLPQLDLALIADIKHWLKAGCGEYRPLMVREPSSAPLSSDDELLQRLRDFVDALVLLIDQPLRFEFSTAAPLHTAVLHDCEQALKPLLLALILEQAHATDQRREALRPQATVITVALTGGEDGVWVDVTDEGIDSISSQHTLKRLRARLPAQVHQLTSQVLPGRGRSFRFLVRT